MTTRSRLRLETFIGSRKAKFSPYTVNAKSYISRDEQCDDDTGSDNSILTISRTTKSGGLINGIEKSNRTGYEWYNYPCGYMADSYLTNHLSIPGQPSDGVLATSVIARTNPGRGESEFVEYLGELKDYGVLAHSEFTNRLRKLKRFIPMSKFRTLKRFARLNLLYQFGIVPLASDIELLMVFQERVDKRVAEIERLRTRGLKRTLNLWDGSAVSGVSNATIQSQGVSLHADIIKHTTVNVRGHIRWYASANWLESDAAVRRQLRNDILGLDIDPAAVYELMPWSWLVDYFTNLGTMVKASYNSFGAHHSAVRIMEHRKTVSTSHNHDVEDQGVGNVITCSPIFSTRETKTRRLTSPTIGARIEFLQPAQWSILGSLAVIRGLK